MDASLEWKIVIGRISTSGHCMVRGEEEDHTIMEEPSNGLNEKKNMEEAIAGDRYLRHLGMDKWILAS